MGQSEDKARTRFPKIQREILNSVTSVVQSNIVQKNARSEKGMGHNGSCPNPASRKFDVWLQLPRQMRILLGKYVHGGQKNLQWEGNLPT